MKSCGTVPPLNKGSPIFCTQHVSLCKKRQFLGYEKYLGSVFRHFFSIENGIGMGHELATLNRLQQLQNFFLKVCWKGKTDILISAKRWRFCQISTSMSFNIPFSPYIRDPLFPNFTLKMVTLHMGIRLFYQYGLLLDDMLVCQIEGISYTRGYL